MRQDFQDILDNATRTRHRASLNVLLELVHAARTTDPLNRASTMRAAHLQDALFCRQVLGIRPGTLVAELGSVHGLEVIRAYVETAPCAFSRDEPEGVTGVWVSGALKRTATRSSPRTGIEKVHKLTQVQADGLSGLASAEWLSRQERLSRFERDLLGEHALRGLKSWVAEYYGVYPGGLADFLGLGPFIVDTMAFDVAAAQDDSIALNIQGRRLRGGRINIAVPLVAAGLQGLS